MSAQQDSQPVDDGQKTRRYLRAGFALQSTFLLYCLLFLYGPGVFAPEVMRLTGAGLLAAPFALFFTFSIATGHWGYMLANFCLAAAIGAGVYVLGAAPSFGFVPQTVFIVGAGMFTMLQAATVWLARDRYFASFLGAIVLSSVAVIVGSAAVFVVTGLKTADHVTTPGEALYFSAVAFSTLGFGDITPLPGYGRLIAAVEAILGNIHLALFTGAAFFIISQGRPEERPPNQTPPLGPDRDPGPVGVSKDGQPEAVEESIGDPSKADAPPDRT